MLFHITWIVFRHCRKVAVVRAVVPHQRQSATLPGHQNVQKRRQSVLFTKTPTNIRRSEIRRTCPQGGAKFGVRRSFDVEHHHLGESKEQHLFGLQPRTAGLLGQRGKKNDYKLPKCYFDDFKINWFRGQRFTISKTTAARQNPEGQTEQHTNIVKAIATAPPNKRPSWTTTISSGSQIRQSSLKLFEDWAVEKTERLW